MLRRSSDLSVLDSDNGFEFTHSEYYIKYYFKYTTDIDKLSQDIKDIYCSDTNIQYIISDGYVDMYDLKYNYNFNPAVTTDIIKASLSKIDIYTSNISGLMGVEPLFLLYMEAHSQNCNVLNKIVDMIKSSHERIHYEQKYMDKINTYLEQC